MPRWWHGGAGWLDRLPALVADWCARWRLTVTGAPVHGSNALVVPVARGEDLFVLRLTPPGPGVAGQVAALQFWDGRGTVRLVQADVDAGVMLLERLDFEGSLARAPSLEAVEVLGRMMRRLAVPAPSHAPSTAGMVARRLTAMPAEWRRLGRPFDEVLLDRAMAAGARMARADSDLAVDGDLHSGQVLRGEREPWLIVDPVLLRDDIAYDLARVLWTRLDDMPGPDSILQHFRIAVGAAGLDLDRCRDGVLNRAVDYWLWGLAAGLTDDPRRCRRLVHAIDGPGEGGG